MDAVDAALVDALRLDGRARHQGLARTLGTSRTSVSARLARLVGSGAVRVVGVVHPSVLGLHTIAHLSLEVDGPAEEAATRAAQDPDVPFVSVVAGAAALVVEVRVGSSQQLAAAVARQRALPGVRGVSTLTYTRLVIDVLNAAAPTTTDIDDLDVALLAALHADGRMSYTRLAEVTGASASAARARVRRMLDEGIVRVGPLVSASAGDRQHAVGVGLRVRGDGEAVVAALAERASTRFLASTTGRFDVLATVHAPTLAGAGEVLDATRALPDVTGLEAWVHLTVVKEQYQRAPVPRAGRA